MKNQHIMRLLSRLERAHQACTSIPDQVETLFSEARNCINQLASSSDSPLVHDIIGAEALPNRSIVVTPGGISFRQLRSWNRIGDIMWAREGHAPVSSDWLCSEAHFPAVVVYLGHEDGRTPQVKSQFTQKASA